MFSSDVALRKCLSRRLVVAIEPPCVHALRDEPLYFDFGWWKPPVDDAAMLRLMHGLQPRIEANRACGSEVYVEMVVLLRRCQPSCECGFPRSRDAADENDFRALCRVAHDELYRLCLTGQRIRERISFTVFTSNSSAWK